MKQIVVTSAVRTAVGSFGGTLKEKGAAELGSIVIKESMIRSGIEKSRVSEIYMGCILQAGLGQNIARQSALLSGLPVETPCTTVNMVCGSGLKSVMLAAQSIKTDDNDIVIAGGTESMSNAPYLLRNLRWGARMGDMQAVDSMVYDGLTDVFSGSHMGIMAENVAKKYGVSRQAQDTFAALSQLKAQAARENGRFKDEIVPISVPQKKGDPIIFDTDEYPRAGTTVEKLSALKPAFQKDGTVTAGNASGINDGAAALVVMSAQTAHEAGITPFAKIVSYACVGVEPDLMGMGPVPAIKKALSIAGLSLNDIGLFELNEAFAAQSLAVIKELNIKPEITNVNGGAIALGHPIGASGARILVTLLHEMQKREIKYGACALCVGGGMGVAMILENAVD